MTPSSPIALRPGALIERTYASMPRLPVAACHIGIDAAAGLAELARSRCGAAGLVVSDAHTRKAAAASVLESLSHAGMQLTEHIFEDDHLDATEALGDAVAAAGTNVDFLVGVGSGTICDLVKHAGTKLKRPVLLYATAASMNGYTSGITAIKVRGLKRTVSCAPALGVFANPEVIAAAPPRMAAAGVGDFLSKCSAGADWRTAHFLRGEYYDENALRFYDGALENVLANSERVGRGEPEAVAVTLEALLLSGLSMLMAGSSSPASGGEHLISHYLDMKQALYGTPHDLHGVQVGVATVHCLRLWERVLATDTGAKDIDALLDAQPTDEDVRAWAWEDWGPDVSQEVLAQWRQKSRPRDALRRELQKFRDDIPALREAVGRDLLPAGRVADAIRAAGGPTEPEGMNAPLEEYRKALVRARFIRNRFTVLDLAAELCIQ
jgi:glycerol-1-phosphate dehydrogenase [NAD(P)+]